MCTLIQLHTDTTHIHTHTYTSSPDGHHTGSVNQSSGGHCEGVKKKKQLVICDLCMSQWPGKVVPLIACSGVIRLPWRLSPRKEKTHMKEGFCFFFFFLFVSHSGKKNPRRAYLVAVGELTHLNPGSHFNRGPAFGKQIQSRWSRDLCCLSSISFKRKSGASSLKKTSAETTLSLHCPKELSPLFLLFFPELKKNNNSCRPTEFPCKV